MTTINGIFFGKNSDLTLFKNAWYTNKDTHRNK